MLILNTTQIQHIAKRFMAALCVCLLLFLLPQTAYAAEAHALVVYCQQDGVRFSLYRVADESDALTGAFSGCGVDVPLDSDNAAAWRSAAQSLQRYAKEQEIAWQRQGDSHDGVLRFEGLENGLYLLLGESFQEDGCTYTPIPVLVRVSGQAAKVYVKHDPEEPTTPEEPTPTDPVVPTGPPAPAEPTLPQTGQLNWPVPVMAALGLCLLLLGMALRSGRKGTPYET